MELNCPKKNTQTRREKVWTNRQQTFTNTNGKDVRSWRRRTNWKTWQHLPNQTSFGVINVPCKLYTAWHRICSEFDKLIRNKTYRSVMESNPKSDKIPERYDGLRTDVYKKQHQNSWMGRQWLRRRYKRSKVNDRLDLQDWRQYHILEVK